MWAEGVKLVVKMLAKIRVRSAESVTHVTNIMQGHVCIQDVDLHMCVPIVVKLTIQYCSVLHSLHHHLQLLRLRVVPHHLEQRHQND